MDALGIEHARFSAPMRSSMEHTNRYTKEIRYRQAYCAVLHGAHERQAAPGNDTGGPGGRRGERVAEMPRPAPVWAGSLRNSFRDGIFDGEGRGIGRKEAGFLHLEIEIEVHLRLFEGLFLQAIVFRLV